MVYYGQSVKTWNYISYVLLALVKQLLLQNRNPALSTYRADYKKQGVCHFYN